MPIQKQLRRTNENSPASSPALMHYYDPKKGPKYPEELTHLPFRTRTTNEDEYLQMISAHKDICYEEIDDIEAPKFLKKVLPTGKLFVIHPMSKNQIRALERKDLDTLKAWFYAKDIYKGTDVQSQMFLEARKTTIERVGKEVFKRGTRNEPEPVQDHPSLLFRSGEGVDLDDAGEEQGWVVV